jgi:hypothetical protein
MTKSEKLEIKKPEIKTAISVVADNISSSTTETTTTRCSGEGQNPLSDKQSEDN